MPDRVLVHRVGGHAGILADPRVRTVDDQDELGRSLDNVDVREGSLFDAVEGETFDLIVSNPPFVVSPDTAFVYRDAGQSGDTVSETIVQGAAAHLREGGFATVVASWVHTTDDDWSARPREWVAAGGCDAWLLRHGTDDPATYAARWNLGLRRNVDEFAGAGASIMLDEGSAVHVLFRLDGSAELHTLVQVVETTGLDRAAVEADAAATLRRVFELGLAVVAGTRVS